MQKLFDKFKQKKRTPPSSPPLKHVSSPILVISMPIGSRVNAYSNERNGVEGDNDGVDYPTVFASPQAFIEVLVFKKNYEYCY